MRAGQRIPDGLDRCPTRSEEAEPELGLVSFGVARGGRQRHRHRPCTRQAGGPARPRAGAERDRGRDADPAHAVRRPSSATTTPCGRSCSTRTRTTSRALDEMADYVQFSLRGDYEQNAVLEPDRRGEPGDPGTARAHPRGRRGRVLLRPHQAGRDDLPGDGHIAQQRRGRCRSTPSSATRGGTVVKEVGGENGAVHVAFLVHRDHRTDFEQGRRRPRRRLGRAGRPTSVRADGVLRLPARVRGAGGGGRLIVGFFSELLLLPLAPVRGVAWVAEKIEEQVDHQMNDPRSSVPRSTSSTPPTSAARSPRRSATSSRTCSSRGSPDATRPEEGRGDPTRSP